MQSTARPGLLATPAAVGAVELEVLAHRAAGVRGDVLERAGLGRGGGDDDRVLHRAVLLERPHHLRDRSTASGRSRRRCR